MKVSWLKPGRRYLCGDRFYTFIARHRRGHETSGRTYSVFQCDDFRGMNGPTDDGRVHLTDHEVNKSISGYRTGTAAPSASLCVSALKK